MTSPSREAISKARARPSASRLLVLVLLELAVERRGPDRELLGGLHLVAAVRAHRRQDVVALDLLQRTYLVRQFRLGRCECELLGQVLELDPVRLCEDDCALDRVLELAYVARPAVARELVQG